MSEYKSADVQRLFDVSSETVRRWADEFEAYLSVSATPGKGRSRIFTSEDMTVFALVADVKNKGGTYDDAHIQLKSGERGSLEDVTHERALDIRGNLEIDMMRQRMLALQEEHEKALTHSKELEGEVIRLQTELKQLDETKTLLKTAQDEINKLHREIGRLEARLEDAKGKSD